MIERTLNQLRNTRDLRAEAISLAADLVGNDEVARLVVVAPLISPQTVRDEWQRLLPAVAEHVAARMMLDVRTQPVETMQRATETSSVGQAMPLHRPNYRYEVLRLLLAASLRRERPPTIRDLIAMIGASQTPIRQALADLKASGLVRSNTDGLIVVPDEMSEEVLARVRALPQTMRLRFARGAQDKSPAVLLQRLLFLASGELPVGWNSMSISGVAVAQRDVPHIDIAGLPRLDFVAHVPRTARSFDIRLLQQLDVGLEVEPNVLAPAPVVLTIVRAAIAVARLVDGQRLRHAAECDVFLSLLDLGLRPQAIQYSMALRS
jgi:hypothetical protein